MYPIKKSADIEGWDPPQKGKTSLSQQTLGYSLTSHDEPPIPYLYKLLHMTGAPYCLSYVLWTAIYQKYLNRKAG